MTTAIGPQAPFFTTTRPPNDVEVSNGVDTWFKNCSGPNAEDGTAITAGFFNVIIAQLREAIRGGDIVLDNSNDEMLLEAIQAIALDVVQNNPNAVLARRGLRNHEGHIEMSIGTGVLQVLT